MGSPERVLVRHRFHSPMPHMRSALEVLRAGVGKEIQMHEQPKRSSLERIAAVLSPLAVIVKVLFELFRFFAFGTQH